jgi:hypothetical protein
MDRTIIGLTERVTLFGKGNKEIVARIDTGATKSSIDSTLAKELGLGPVLESKLVKTAHGNKLRPVIKANIRIKDLVVEAKFTLSDRHHMKYRVLIGQNILKKGFLIDPSKK